MQLPFYKILLAGYVSLAIVAPLAAQDMLRSPDNDPAQSGVPVERVVITDQAIDDTLPVEGYRAITSVSATKTNTPLQDVPQSVQVVTRQVMEAQGDETLTDATRNVSGVTGLENEREINNAGFLVRGFAADTYLDGIRQYENFPNLDSLVNVERIEVLKGPAAVLYTGSTGAPLGGSVNIVTKSPQPAAFAQIGLRGGSFNTAETFIDVNQPLDPTGKGRLLLRITGDVYRADDFIDHITSERWSIFPTLTLRTEDDRSEFNLRGRYSYRQANDYSGLPGTGTVLPAPYTIPRDRFIGTLDQPDTTNSTFQLTGTLSHRFNDVYTLNLLAGYVDNNLNQYTSAAFPVTPIALGSPLFNFATLYLPNDVHEVTVSPSLVAHFRTGARVEHMLLAGFDYDHTTERADLFYLPTLTSFDVLNPTYPHFTLAGGSNVTNRDSVYETYGGYLQEQATLFDRLHLLGSVRFTQLDILDRNRVAGTSAEFNRFKVTPRGGAVYDLPAGFALYGDYGEGFQAPLGFEGIANVKPLESQVYEGGLRWTLPNKLTASVAGFHVVRENDFAADPNNPYLQIQVGQRRSQGAEVDVLWQATPSVTLLFNYAYIDAEITQDTLLPVGAALPRTPRHSGRFWARYDVHDGPFRGLGFSAGVSAGTSRADDDANSFFTQDYYTVDAQISYVRGPWALRVNVENLTDRHYYEPYVYLGGSVAPNRPASVFATVAYTFGPHTVTEPTSPLPTKK